MQFFIHSAEKSCLSKIGLTSAYAFVSATAQEMVFDEYQPRSGSNFDLLQICKVMRTPQLGTLVAQEFCVSDDMIHRGPQLMAKLVLVRFS